MGTLRLQDISGEVVEYPITKPVRAIFHLYGDEDDLGFGSGTKDGRLATSIEIEGTTHKGVLFCHPFAVKEVIGPQYSNSGRYIAPLVPGMVCNLTHISGEVTAFKTKHPTPAPAPVSVDSMGDASDITRAAIERARAGSRPLDALTL
jgi:hypothetical protein